MPEQTIKMYDFRPFRYDYLTQKDVYSEEAFQNILELLEEAGNRLHEVNKKIQEKHLKYKLYLN